MAHLSVATICSGAPLTSHNLLAGAEEVAREAVVGGGGVLLRGVSKLALVVMCSGVQCMLFFDVVWRAVLRCPSCGVQYAAGVVRCDALDVVCSVLLCGACRGGAHWLS